MKFSAVVLDQSGRPVSGASVNVYQPGTSTPATVYTDETLQTVLTQPITTDSKGHFEFWALGRVKVEASKASYTLMSVDDLELFSPLQRVCGISNSSTQSIPDATLEKVAFGTADLDPMNFADLANNEIVIPTGHAGHYILSAHVEIATGIGVQRRIEIHRNGSVDATIYGAVVRHAHPGAAGGVSFLSTAAIALNLASGDQLSVRVFQDSGGPLDASNARFAAALIGK